MIFHPGQRPFSRFLTSYTAISTGHLEFFASHNITPTMIRSQRENYRLVFGYFRYLTNGASLCVISNLTRAYESFVDNVCDVICASCHLPHPSQYSFGFPVFPFFFFVIWLLSTCTDYCLYKNYLFQWKEVGIRNIKQSRNENVRKQKNRIARWSNGDARSPHSGTIFPGASTSAPFFLAHISRYCTDWWTVERSVPVAPSCGFH